MLMEENLRDWAGVHISMDKSHLESGVKNKPATGVWILAIWTGPGDPHSEILSLGDPGTGCSLWENRDTSPGTFTVRRLCFQPSLPKFPHGTFLLSFYCFYDLEFR